MVRKLLSDWRNIVIGVLAVMVLVLSSLVLPERLVSSGLWEKDRPEGEPVSVLDVVLDRENLRTIDLVFSGSPPAAVGEVLGREPATISPRTGGVWRWYGANVIRFESTGGLNPATEYEIQLVPENFLSRGQSLVGESVFNVITDQFQVERVDVFEEPGEESGQVIIRGVLRFNYPVEPRELLPRLRLLDPARNAATPVLLETTYPNSEVSFQSEPVLKLQQERELDLVIASDLTPVLGNVSLPADFVQKIQIGSRVTLSVRGVSPTAGETESSIQIIFSSAVSSQAAESFVMILPEVEYRVSGQRNILYLTGAFKPGSSYDLTIREGLGAEDQSTLTETFEGRIQIPDLDPSVRFRHQGAFLSRTGYRTLGLESVNVGSFQLTVDRVYLNNLLFLFEYFGYMYRDTEYYQSWLAHSLGDRIGEQKIRVAGERNQMRNLTLNLGEYIDEGEPGLYRVAVRQPDSYSGEQRWVLITDMGIVAKRGQQDFLVWVSSFRDLSPVANARIRLVSDQNQLIAEGSSDTRGLWRLPSGARGLDKHRPFLVTVEKGNDFSFLLLDSTAVDTVGLDVGGDATSRAGYQAYLYGERNIYRPGEQVKGVAVVRDEALGVPPSMPLLLRHRDPQGRQRATTRLTLSTSEGVAEFEVEIPPYEPTGSHTFELLVGDDVIGSYRFQVEEFVPDRIKVEITSEERDLQAEEELTFTVRSSYLFGPPAAALPVDARVRLVAAPFAPPSFQQFTFGDRDRRFESREVYSDESALDDRGEKTFRIDLPRLSEVPAALEAVITARVQEQGGRGVTALTRRKIHVYPYYIGIRRDGDSLPEPRQEVTFEYAGVTPDGTSTATGDLAAHVYRDRWQTVLRKTPSGNFRYESTRDPELVQSLSLAGGSQRGTFRFTPGEFGSYRVVVTDSRTGASSSLEFYASGWGYSPWAIKNPSQLEIDLDRDEYGAGETAVAQIRAPFPGKLLLTVERERVLYTQTHVLSGNTAKIQIPIQSDFRPNAYVTATLIRSVGDLEAGGVARSFGAVPLYVDKSRNQLTLELKAPNQVRPDTDLAVDVQTVPGARVTVAAVDEGILQLIAQKTANPFDYFYRKRALGTGTHDIFALLFPEVAPIEDTTIAGGGMAEEGLAQFVRTEGIRRDRPVTFWSGVVATDSNGRARVEFHVPEFQGALRLMAVALRRDRFGSTDQLVRVRSPIVLLPTFPRFLSLEEGAQIPLTVRNDTGRDGDFQVNLQVSGPAQLDGQERQSARVPNGAERTLYFALKTSASSGDLGVRLTAAGNGETATVRSELTVRPDLPAVTIRKAGRVEQASTSLPLEEQQFRENSVTREVLVSPLPLMQFSGRMRDLFAYPYGCLEQSISRVFPLLYFDELAREWAPDLFEETGAAGAVQAGIRRLMSMQLFNGGFGMWPGSSTLYPWGSVYAAHFLVEARKAGFHVDEYAYKQALAFLSDEVKGSAAFNAVNLRKTLYGLYALARAGEADLGSMDFVRQNHLETLRPVDKALLGAAYAATGNPQAYSELVGDLEDVDTVDRQTGGILNSTIRNRALLLLALVESDPSDTRIGGLVERLARDAGTTWTTHETGLVFVALGRFFRQQAQTADYSGTVLVGSRELGRFEAKTTRFAGIQDSGPISIRMDPGYQSGAAFFSLSTRGVPSDSAFQPSQAGLEILRELRTRDGRPLESATVRQGDLVVMKTQVRSRTGPVENVVLSLLLPSGLEVENPRLKTTESLPWMANANLEPSYLDLRDDRVLMFLDLSANQWRTAYALLRAVTPGDFRLPPPQAEAMYDPSIRATGSRGRFKVEVRN